MNGIAQEIRSHYASTWGNEPEVRRWEQGPVSDLPPSFCVLEFRPSESRKMWTYATCGMSEPSDTEPLELHLFSPKQCVSHVELVTAIAHYHRTGQRLGLGHTVRFGRPWFEGSNCDHGLISLPYLDGPTLEEFHPVAGGVAIRFLWLVPITKAERDYKKASGLEALERRLEEASFNYLDPYRQSVI